MSLLSLPTSTSSTCERIDGASGHHHCLLAPQHAGACACGCDPCVDRADRLAAY